MSTTTHWTERHAAYKDADWIAKASMFAETAVGYFPSNGTILELGAGQGQDSRFFAGRGYEVISSDLTDEALELNRQKLSPALTSRLRIQKIDLQQRLPFEDGKFDVVYAHLALHYFDEATTERIFSEIARVLRPGGTLAFLVNSTDDPEYQSGEELEPDFFRVGTQPKRFFTPKTAAHFAAAFSPTLLDNHGESYKDAAKGIHNLIRFVGTKK